MTAIVESAAGDDGTIEFHGEFVRAIEQRARAVVPLRELGEAATVAGDDGMLELGSELNSLFGLRDAIAFAEKTSGVHMP